MRDHFALRWANFGLSQSPLDGTKEFVKRNGEFTVNIALVQDGVPVSGIIHIPALGLLYLGGEGEGAWEVKDGRRRAVHVPDKATKSPVRILSSRSHASPNLGAILDLFPSHEAIVKGSALKFCAVAAGEADFYPRLGPTWEWDTAAGQAIVEASGGVVVDLKGGPFRYNKPNLVNGPFLVAGSLKWLNETGVLGRTRSLEPA